MLTGTLGYPTRAEYAKKYGYPYGGKPVGYGIHNFGEPGDSDSLEGLMSHHVGTLGWPWAGYFAVVFKDGHIIEFNDPNVASYHIAGRNHDLVGICFAGNQDLHPPTDAQIAAFNWYHATRLLPLFGPLPVDGHRQYAPSTTKTCPGSTWETWRHRISGT